MKLLLLLLLAYNAVAQSDDIFTNEFEALVTTRISYLELKDPHFFADFPIFDCTDITYTTPLGDGINPLVNSSIVNDEDGDDFLDLSLVTRYNTDQPDYLVGRSTVAVFSEAECTDDLSCAVNPVSQQTVFTTFPSDSPSLCLDVEPGTTRPYTPTIISTSGPCYVTDPQDVTLDLNGIIITLNDAQQSLRYSGGIDADQGLIKGFLTEATAESVILPPHLPIIGGETLASILRGHENNCSANSDMDIHPILGDGWWMYFNFTAELVQLSQMN